MGNPPIYQQTAQSQQSAAGTAVEAPPPVNQDQDLEQRVAQMVEARLSEVETKYQDRIAELEKSLSRTNRPGSGLPTNSAGPGDEIAPTWSQHLQSLANEGKLTAEHLVNLAGYAEDKAKELIGG